MSATSDLLYGLAQYLADQGIVTYPLAAGTSYTAGQTGVTFDLMPQAPDRVVCLTAYAASDDAANPWSSMRVQVRTRGLPSQPDDLWTLRDSVYNALQSESALTFGTVTVAQILRVSSVPLGMDTNRRFEHADNYQLDIQLPATANRQ